MITLSNLLVIPDKEIELHAIRAQGSGGQHINKVSTAIHLRFDINNSSLPKDFKEKLQRLVDHHISAGCVIIIKAQRFRSQDKNKVDALSRLKNLLNRVTVSPKKRIATRQSKKANENRLTNKSHRSGLKTSRSTIHNQY